MVHRVLVGMIGFSWVSSCGVTLFDLISVCSSKEPKGFSGYNWVLLGLNLLDLITMGMIGFLGVSSCER